MMKKRLWRLIATVVISTATFSCYADSYDALETVLTSVTVQEDSSTELTIAQNSTASSRNRRRTRPATTPTTAPTANPSSNTTAKPETATEPSPEKQPITAKETDSSESNNTESSDSNDRNNTSKSNDEENNTGASTQETSSDDDLPEESDVDVYNARIAKISSSDTEKKDFTEWFDKPFDVNWDTIPDTFLGHNISELYFQIRTAYELALPTVSKGMFETTSDYQQRIRKEKNDQLYPAINGSLTFGSKVAFALFPELLVAKLDSKYKNRIGKVSDLYDADHKRWMLTLEFTRDAWAKRTKDVSWIDFCIFDPAEYDSYTGVNAFNAKTEVLKINTRAYGIQAKYKLPKDFRGDLTDLSRYSRLALYGVPSSYAKEHNGKIACLVVCNLEFVKPFHRISHREPKFTDPYDITIRENYIAVDNVEFWFYDFYSNEVIARCTLDELFKGKMKSFERATVIRNRVEGADVSDVDDAEGEETIKTWDDVLAESVDNQESWEKKKAKVTIPDDAASLEEAFAMTQKGDVIQIKASEKSVPLKSGKVARGGNPDLILDHSVAIVGEAGRAEECVVELDGTGSLRIESRDLVAIGGITFAIQKNASSGAPAPMVTVADGATAKFKNTLFDGGGVENATGINVVGEYSKTSFWKCRFSRFGQEGLRVENSAKTTLQYCQFIMENRYGLAALSSASVDVGTSLFSGNVTGFLAEGGGGVVVHDSFFMENSAANWSISTGSRSACNTKEGNTVWK